MIQITSTQMSHSTHKRAWVDRSGRRPMQEQDVELAILAGSVLSRESAAVAALVGVAEAGVVEVARRVLAVRGKVVTTGSGTSGIMAERLAPPLSACWAPAGHPPPVEGPP